MAGQRYRHIILSAPPNQEAFTSTGSGRSRKRIPDRDPLLHSSFLSKRFTEAWAAAENEQVVAHVVRHGVYIEFKSDPDAELVTKSLEDMRSKRVRLLNVRTAREPVTSPATDLPEEKVTTYATVYIAHDKKDYFLKKIQEYAEKVTPKGKPANSDLVNSISDIRKALLVDSFWQDPQVLKPTAAPEWCEVWLSTDTREAIDRFERLLNQERIEAKAGVVRFPERAVKVILANEHTLKRLTTLSDDIAEYRLAKVTSSFWTKMDNSGQADWLKDLLQRTSVEADTGVAVCILDTGVNNGHDLLAPVLRDQDCLTVDPNWGIGDRDARRGGHGTRMAGVAAYGDLRKCLASRRSLRIHHRLESVKILPPHPETNHPDLWGYITAQGVSRAEIQAPDRKRIHCMAVTAADARDRGRPSSWSASLDQLAAGAEDGVRRLLVVSSGNLEDTQRAPEYPEAQLSESIHDPGQAWNSLTVGAYTELDQIIDGSYSGYKPIAPRGGLSPFTSTSCTWEQKWPMKPDIVMEGGNMAHDGCGFATECEDLSNLSTYWKPSAQYLCCFNMTSAAAAQAAWFGAQVQVHYPEIWPETVRALMVHSAEWTDTLKRQFLPPIASKASYARLMRICGYGVPSLDRALYSAANALTLIAQAELQPFDKSSSGTFRTKDMHIHDLPWPREVLLGLPFDVQVQMRVTLSYFVEPGPGEIGWNDRYRYASHALRFELNSPGESMETFLKRINAAVRDENEGHPGTQSASDHWVIGANSRNRGSIHSDIWQGTAAELAASNLVAVYPRIGWWRERHHLGRWNRKTRYALIVSITTPEEQADIYTTVATQVGITVQADIST